MAVTASTMTGGAEGETDIVTARNVEGGLLAGLDVEGGLGFGDAGGRLEGYTKYYRRAVRDTAVDAAGTVLHGGHRTFFKLKRVIMFRAFHPGGCETVTELYATDSRDGEHSMRNQGLDRIEERFSKTGRNSGDPALDNAAKRIAFLGGFVQKIAPLGLVRLSSDLYQTGLKAEPLTHFLCDDSGGDQREGLSCPKNAHLHEGH